MTLNAIAIAAALLNSQVYGEPIQPTPVYKAAKILNETGETITFRYQFEDQHWRSGRLTPHGAVYIYDADPANKLTIHYHSVGRVFTYSLETNDVSGRREPDTRRNDQARLYYFATGENGIAMYDGVPPAWYAGSVQNILSESQRHGVDLSVFRSPVNVDHIDPILCQAEFRRFESLLRKEFQKRMRSGDAPDLELRWQPESWGDAMRFLPRVTVVGSCGSSGAEFYRRIIERSLRARTAEIMYSVAVVCKAGPGTTVRRPYLNAKYIHGNTIYLTQLVDDIVNDLRQNTLIGASRVVRDDKFTYTIYGEWNYGSLRNAQYEWRGIVTTAIKFDENRQAGVSLRVDVEVRKRYVSSANWQYVSRFAVADLETFPESALRIREESTDSRLEPIDHVSKAARICNEVEHRLAKIVSPQYEPLPSE